VGVQEGVRVAEDLQVHPTERRIAAPAGVLDRLTEQRHAGEELGLSGTWQV
jgi:hypothetical protein